MKAPPIPQTVLPVLNGLFGDKLAASKSKWAIGMHFRIDGKDVPVSKLKQYIKSKHVVVFVHGLMADEKMWKGFRFRKSLSVLHVRYNTGLHISQNGRNLSKLLNSLYKELGFKKLFLVGHSMGGLVVRSACYYGKRLKHRWVNQVSLVFLIAVPNAGAALEKISHATSFVLRRIARWYLGHVGNLMEQRSDGIKDLRLGFMVDEDWKNGTPKLIDTFKRTPVPPLSGVRYHILVGSLSKDENSLMAKYFGDGLVTPGSAVAETLISVSHVESFPGAGHNALLKDPRVRKYVRDTIYKNS